MSEQPWLTDDVINLDRDVVAEKQLWRALLQIAGRLDPQDWVLVGGQMVALHGYIHGSTPPRTSDDIDLVANLLVRAASLQNCASAAESINLTPRPSLVGKYLQRFEGDGIKVDLLVPDTYPVTSYLVFADTDQLPSPVGNGRSTVHTESESASVGSRRPSCCRTFRERLF
ncbi:MAG: hypothetical protein AAB327_07420 [Actinomycetota bacterium]